MTKRSRRLLFYAFILIFALISIVVVAVAFGYAYDFAHNRIVKTGALGLTSNTSASVYVNDKLEGQTSFLNNSLTKNRMIPGEYRIRMDKKDYFTWQKKITINAGIYTDFPSIVLMPTQLRAETVASASSVPKQQLLYGDLLFYFDLKGFLNYRDINADSKNGVFDGVHRPKITSKYKIAVFDESSGKLVIVSDTLNYLFDPNSGTTTVLGVLPFPTSSIYLRNNIIYGLNNGQVLAYDTTTNTSKVIAKKVRSFAADGTTLAYIDTTSLHFYSLNNGGETGTVTLPRNTIRIKQFLQQDNGYVILQSTSLSSLYKINGNALTLISNYADHMVLDSGQDKLLYSTAHEISVYYLRATNRQPYMDAGDQELITRESQTITNPVWYHNGEHILARIGGQVVMLEIDGRGGRNTYTLTDTSGFEYSPSLDAIYNFTDRILQKIPLK